MEFYQATDTRHRFTTNVWRAIKTMTIVSVTCLGLKLFITLNIALALVLGSARTPVL